jgi:hypothetical protein
VFPCLRTSSSNISSLSVSWYIVWLNSRESLLNWGVRGENIDWLQKSIVRRKLISPHGLFVLQAETVAQFDLARGLGHGVFIEKILQLSHKPLTTRVSSSDVCGSIFTSVPTSSSTPHRPHAEYGGSFGLRGSSVKVGRSLVCDIVLQFCCDSSIFILFLRLLHQGKGSRRLMYYTAT